MYMLEEAEWYNAHFWNVKFKWKSIFL